MWNLSSTDTNGAEENVIVSEVSLTLGARMRSEGYSTCFVCLSVTTLAATAFVSTCNQRHLRHYYRLFLDFNSWIFEKAFRSKVMSHIFVLFVS